MSKKHFEMIARILRVCLLNFESDLKKRKIQDREYALSKGAMEGIKMTILALGIELESKSPRFDKQRFYIACGLNGSDKL